jgi:hypothetical protein
MDQDLGLMIQDQKQEGLDGYEVRRREEECCVDASLGMCGVSIGIGTLGRAIGSSLLKR